MINSLTFSDVFARPGGNDREDMARLDPPPTLFKPGPDPRDLKYGEIIVMKMNISRSLKH